LSTPRIKLAPWSPGPELVIISKTVASLYQAQDYPRAGITHVFSVSPRALPSPGRIQKGFQGSDPIPKVRKPCPESDS